MGMDVRQEAGNEAKQSPDWREQYGWDGCVAGSRGWSDAPLEGNSMVEQSFDGGINMKQRPSEEDQSAKKWGMHKTSFNLWDLYAADQ